MGPLLAAAPAVAALLVAAKAHGRQVRLLRERAGHFEVTFGGSNPPFVEALWRADRIRFWSTVPLAAAALGGAAWWYRGGPLAALAALVWAPTLGFALCGALAWRRTRREYPADPDAERGGLAWWSLAAGLWGLSVAAGSG